MLSVPILILAGGASARFPGDKLLQPVDGVPLIRDRALAALETGHPVIVAMRPGRPDRIAALEGLPVAIRVHEAALEGMGGTQRAAVAALPPCDRFLMLLADLPDITAEDIATVLRAPAEAPDAVIWRGATQDRRPGHPVLFDAALRGDFRHLKGDDGGRSLVSRYVDRTCLVDLPGDRARRDLDTPEDWAAWRAETGR